MGGGLIAVFGVLGVLVLLAVVVAVFALIKGDDSVPSPQIKVTERPRKTPPPRVRETTVNNTSSRPNAKQSPRTARATGPVLRKGGRAKVVAAGDDRLGQIGIVDVLLDEDDGLDVFLRFDGVADLYVFRREEVVPVGGGPQLGNAKRTPIPGKSQTRPTRAQAPSNAPRPSASPTAQRPSGPSRWADRPAIIERVLPDTSESWLQSIQDTGPNRILRGSSRWIAGLAILGAGGALILSTFLEWGRATTPNFTATVSGVGSVSIQAPGSSRTGETLVTGSAIGAWALVVGLLGVLLGAGFLWTQWRSATALAVAILGGIGFLVCLQRAMTIATIMKPMTGAPSDYQVGIGLLLACASALVLSAVAVTAFVLERLSTNNHSNGN